MYWIQLGDAVIHLRNQIKSVSNGVGLKRLGEPGALHPYCGGGGDMYELTSNVNVGKCGTNPSVGGGGGLVRCNLV